jgi:hypothetical protein
VPGGNNLDELKLLASEILGRIVRPVTLDVSYRSLFVFGAPESSFFEE